MHDPLHRQYFHSHELDTAKHVRIHSEKLGALEQLGEQARVGGCVAAHGSVSAARVTRHADGLG